MVFSLKLRTFVFMWTYNNKEVKSIEDVPEGAVGFIYLLVNKQTGRKYIGKKLLYSNRKRRFTKKEIAALTNKRLKKWEIVTKETEWLTYNSSSEEINEEYRNGVEFERLILSWTFSKRETQYLEVKLQFQNEVLESDEWYNKNIASKWFKGNLK